MSSKPVVVYGASGYTGRLVCEALRNYRIPFLAAGRDGARVEEAMRLVPGIETADYEVVEVAHDVSALADLFGSAEVVCNTVGPFNYYGETVVEACAKADTHYLDTTGEVPFMGAARDKFSDAFKANGKTLSPSTAYMHSVSEIAAQIVLETAGIDTLEVICSANGTPTYGSTQTIFSMFQNADKHFYIENNERVTWPAAKGYDVHVPGLPISQLAHDWGGGSLPLFLENDPRVRNCRHLTSFTNRPLMEQIVAMQQMYENDLKHLPMDAQQKQLKAIGESVQAGMPPRENPLIHRCTDHVEGRGGNNTASCTIRSMNPYQLTGILQAATANFLIKGHQKTSGFASACQTVGHWELLGQLQNFGLVSIEVN
ncbi:MAG: saccharopine dehydrogenase [Alphaproteobacteria bacterium HGW-Alphaproteobacteria-5]|nr:MAG: saccharopine dehydrogenase [Alphaproteobacteria bacterium HGW-Alphaproteobacteria-5]